MTLIEMMVVLAVLTAVVAIAIPSFSEWSRNQKSRAVARSVADLLLLARAESIRTGNRYVVFFGNPGTTDPSGNPVERSGQWVPVLLVDDGPPATSNCRIDAGEIRTAIEPETGMSWGTAGAGTKVASDEGVAPFGSPTPWDGATFADPTNAKANWVMFRPDGLPVGFTGAIGSCGTIGNLGTGGGGLYVTNGERDFAVVLSPLGGVRLHVWNAASGAWSG